MKNKKTKKRKSEKFLYIFCGTKALGKYLIERFDVPGKDGFFIGVDNGHMAKISNKTPIGKKMGELLKKHTTKNGGTDENSVTLDK